jgi:hypothetical protein
MSAPSHEDAVILLKMYELGSTAEQSQAWRFIFGPDFIEDYEGFVKEYSPATEEYNLLFAYLAWFEMLGTLWKHKLLNETLLLDWLLIPPRWKRVERFVLGYRKATGEAHMFENFEALAKAAP